MPTDADMKLPEGRACIDCNAWRRCKALIGSLNYLGTRCDWSPSRFVLNETPFEPDQVVLSVPPLTGTLGRSEVEVAAAMVIRTLQRRGEGWGPVDPNQIGEMLHADEADNSPTLGIWTNPFCRPDAEDLVARGFARWLGEPRKSELELTDDGIFRLRRWVRDPTPAPAPTTEAETVTT